MDSLRMECGPKYVVSYLLILDKVPTYENSYISVMSCLLCFYNTKSIVFFDKS